MSTSNGVSRLTRPAKTATYRPTVYGTSWNNIIDNKPLFTWREVDRMRYDPQVQFGLRILRAPLYGVTWKVTADSDIVGRWIDRGLKRVYNRLLPRRRPSRTRPRMRTSRAQASGGA